MSKIIASAAIRGAHKIFKQAQESYARALDKFGAEPGGRFSQYRLLPPHHLRHDRDAVSRIEDMKKVLDLCRKLIPAPVRESTHLPYLAPALDAGMATFFAEEIIEAIRYLEDPDCYVTGEEPR